MKPKRSHRGVRLALACAAALAIAGCAGPQLGSEWSDPQLAGKKPLAAAKVYVSCQALEMAVQRVCIDKLSARLRTLGAVPLSSAPVAVQGSVPEPPTVGRELAAARESGAAAMLAVSISPAATSISSAPTLSIGVGGFSGGGHGGGGVGLGVGMPVGGTATSTGYAASASLIDVGSGKLMWTANASAPASSNVDEQLETLSATLLDSASKSGMF